MGMLENQVVIITGAARGVGRAASRMMAEHGARLVMADLDREPLEQTAKEIEAEGGRVVTVAGDVTKEDFPKVLVENAIQSFGQLDILVNNAGYTWDGLLHKMSNDQFQAMLDIHLITPFRMIRQAAPYMRDDGKKEREGGTVHYRKIVNVSSLAGVMGNVGQANYSSAKAGVIGLTKTIAKEWAPFNINCNAVAFGLIDTRMTQVKENGKTVKGIAVGIPEKVRNQFEHSIPQGRAGTPEEAAAGIFYLASPISNYTNGHVLNISGAWYT
ncbi:MAG TPA: SDR family NAD(P)-dependent oxidoreductase [Bacillales bacterium]|nr:SDR family NAD(P)-dependent oxidoreductase [Bacillales bacterium]